MILLNHLRYSDKPTYLFLGCGIARKLPATFHANHIDDFQVLPVSIALKENLIPDFIPIPEAVPISPGSPVETPIDKWVLISFIKPDSLEPYLRDIYMEKLNQIMSQYAKKTSK